mgnify:CR=1 FL=1
MSNHLLEVKNLRTHFASGGGIVQAVRGVDIHVDAGEFLGIVGESGCGKSVTMMSIMRLLAENAAVKADSLVFDGRDILSQSEKTMRSIRGNEIGMIFQDPMTSLNPLFTVGNQMMEHLRLHKNMTKEQAKARAIEMLTTVGINEPEKRLKQYPHEMSGGMRQRVMIAIAMCCNPKILIADEPTTALDVTIQAQIMELMEDLKNNFSTAVILITHDLGVIARSCSRVIVMYGGLIMEEGSVEQIFYEPAHPYTEGLLRSVPRHGIEEEDSESQDKGGEAQTVERQREKLIPIPGSPPDLMNPPAGCPFAARCEKAMKICKMAPAQLTEVGEGHRSACWLLHSQAPGKDRER